MDRSAEVLKQVNLVEFLTRHYSLEFQFGSGLDKR